MTAHASAYVETEFGQAAGDQPGRAFLRTRQFGVPVDVVAKFDQSLLPPLDMPSHAFEELILLSGLSPHRGSEEQGGPEGDRRYQFQRFHGNHGVGGYGIPLWNDGASLESCEVHHVLTLFRLLRLLMAPPDPVADFERVLHAEGLHAALRFLNSRTPHRFTGVYRYDGEILRNVALFDQFAPDERVGDDVPMCDAYCAVVGQQQSSLEFADVHRDNGVTLRPRSAVVSYCGALIVDDDGLPFGTLCHFDTKRSEARKSDIPLLEQLAPLIFQAVRRAEEDRQAVG